MITLTTTPLPDPLRTAVSSAVIALRWAAAGYGVVVVASHGAANHTWTAVWVMAAVVFFTTLRTVSPLNLGASGSSEVWAVIDTIAFSLAAGWSGGTESPWVFCAMAAVAIASYGWGVRLAVLTTLVAAAGVAIGTAVSQAPLSPLMESEQDFAILAVMVVAAIAGVYVRARLIEVEEQRKTMAGEVDRLGHANRLLRELSDVALTLPGAFSLREALERTRETLRSVLDPEVAVLITQDEHNDEWTPKITDGVAMRASYVRGDLPDALNAALQDDVVTTRSSGEEFVAVGSNSGVYMPLRARGRLIGVLGLEHSDPEHFSDLAGPLRDGLGDIVALTVDNSRWFGRLRSLGAEDERIRVARDIHDRLGQWMTYIKLELDRLRQQDQVTSEELDRLHSEATDALEELRETLKQLRTGVSDDRPLAVLGEDLVARFSNRTHVDAQFDAVHPDERLPVPVENELLRILQEALNNVDRHAQADHVEVIWNVEGGNFELRVVDDGSGFDPGRAVRNQTYGVIGMQERADVIGATLHIDSTLGEGTTVKVSAGHV